MAKFPHHFHVYANIPEVKNPPGAFTCFPSRKAAEVYSGILARMAKDRGLTVKGNKETGFLVGYGSYLAFQIEVVRIEGNIDDCQHKENSIKD